MIIGFGRSGSFTPVTVMQTAWDWDRYYRTVLRRVYGTRLRAILLETLMGSICVVISFDVFGQNPMKMPLPQDDKVVQTVPP
jgi:hypothetical protein